MPCFIRATILESLRRINQQQWGSLFSTNCFKAQKWQADGAREEQNHWSSPSFSSSSSSSSSSPSFLPSFLPSFFITDSFFLAKNIGDGIQTCVSKFKPSLVQGLVLLGIVGRSDGQDIHLSHQLSHQRFLSVSLLLVSVLSILCITPALRAISLFYELWRLFCFVSFFFFFFATTQKFFTISILLQQQQQQNSQPNSSIAALLCDWSTATANRHSS